VRLLLDTHTLLWWLGGSSRLGSVATATIADPSAEVLVSAASAWEIGIKTALGKLQTPTDLSDQLAAHGFTELPVTVTHALCAGRLPLQHRDPFDRMLVAQAIVEQAALVTVDPRIAAYDVAILAADR
jgi:PIN domain nuclease of toxin-antitoxin system